MLQHVNGEPLRGEYQATFKDIFDALGPEAAVYVRAREKAPAFKDWPNRVHSETELRKFHRDGANRGLKAGRFPAFDCDSENETFNAVVKNAIVSTIGATLERYRPNSNRRLYAAALAPDEAPIKKMKLAMEGPNGELGTLEILGIGQQFIIGGIHPSGAPYLLSAPLNREHIASVTKDQASQVLQRVRSELEAKGWSVATATDGATAGSRKPIGDTSLVAPSIDHVRRMLTHWKNTAENNPTRDHLVRAAAAIKAATAPWAYEGYEFFCEWQAAYEGNDPEDLDRIWSSIRDSELGYDWLVSQARSKGYDGDAQEAFAEPPPAEFLDSAPTKSAAPAVKLLHLDALEALSEPNDFIEGTLCDGQSSVFYGDANVGKSFVALDAAMHVALGLNWHGREVERGGVIYVAAEGAGGMRRRVRAFRHHHGFERTAGAMLAFVADTINFRDDQAVKALFDAAMAAGRHWKLPVRWIVVDTLARALFGGNENAPDDMGALLRGAGRLQAATGAHLTFIHHSGKDDARGARGHSSLRAAIDTEIKFERQDGDHGAVRATITKQRDMEIGPGFAFKLQQVRLGEDRRGRPVTSCVVEPAEIKVPLTDSERAALEKLSTLLFDATETTVAIGDWRKAVLSGDDVVTGQSPDSRGKQWQRIRDSLKKKRVIELSGERVGLRGR